MRPVEMFVANLALILLIIGSVLILSPGLFKRMADFFNRTIASIDDMKLRRSVGIFLLGVSIFLWYVAMYKIRM